MSNPSQAGGHCATRINGVLLLAVLATSAFNVLPLVLAPLAAVGLAFCGSICFAWPGAGTRRIAGRDIWFLAFMAYSIAFAALIGVDVSNPHLYRREFKFVVPLTAFVVLSSLRYSVDLLPKIKNALLWISFASFLWLVWAMTHPSYVNHF